MAATTIRTFYGDIPLDAQGVPILQFDTANVLIKLGDDPVDWLLLHLEILRAASPVFKAASSEDWVSTKSIVVSHPSSSRDVEVAVLTLTVDHDTYILEGMHIDTELFTDPFPYVSRSFLDHEFDPDGLPYDPDFTRDFVFFNSSDIAVPGWDHALGLPLDLDLTKTALRWMFALMYGAPLSMHFPLYSYSQTNEAGPMQMIFLIGSYAAYYDCVDIIGPAITEALRATNALWRTVAQSPTRFMILGKHFHDSELYYDAFRHALAQANANQKDWELELDSDWYWLADHLGKDRGNLEAEFANQLSSIDNNLEQLEEICMTLVITMGRAPNHIEALAHSFFLQWMLAVLTENFRYGFHNSKTHCPMGSLLLRIYGLIPIEDPGDDIMQHMYTVYSSEYQDNTHLCLAALISTLRTSEERTEFWKCIQDQVQRILRQRDRLFPGRHNPYAREPCPFKDCQEKHDTSNKAPLYNAQICGVFAYFDLPNLLPCTYSRDLIELIDELGDLEMHVTPVSTAWVAALVAAQPDLRTIFDQLEMDWELTDCVETVREAQDTDTTVNDNEGWSDAETCAEIGDLIAAGLMSW